MIRSILVLFLLIVQSTVAWAACTVDPLNVTVTTSGPNSENSVVFNPFNVQASTIQLSITTTGGCASSLSGEFLAGHTDSNEPAGFPIFELKNGATTVYNSDTSTSYTAFSETITAPPLAQTVFNYSFSVVPTAQGNGESALGKLDDNAHIVLQLTADGVTQDIQLTLPVSIPQVNDIALTDNFTSGDTTQNVAFGTLDGTETSITDKKLYLWSNTQYKVSVDSTNNGVMLRDGFSTGDTALNTLPYKLILSKSGTSLLTFDDSSPASGVETSTQGASTVDGENLDLAVTIAAGASDTRRAGNYNDTVTITISAVP